MEKVIRNRSIVTYKDTHTTRKISSNDVEVELVCEELKVDYECYKNAALIGEPCTFVASIHNISKKPLRNCKVYFHFSDNLVPLITSVYINKKLYKKGDFRGGIYLGTLSSYECMNIAFVAKMFPSSNNQAFTQVLVSYNYYQDEMLIDKEKFSQLVSIKVLG